MNLSISQLQTKKRFEDLTPISIQEAKETYNPRDFKRYIPEVIPVINAIIATGQYPYNSVIVEELKELPEFSGCTDEFLNHFTYQGQQYRQGYELITYLEGKVKELQTNGFEPVNQEKLTALANTKKFVTVYREGLGEIKAKLFQDAENTLYWMLPRVRKTGYRALVGDYIKAK